MCAIFTSPSILPFPSPSDVPCGSGCIDPCQKLIFPGYCVINTAYVVEKCCPDGWDADLDPNGNDCYESVGGGFAECLNANKVKYNTPEKLLNLVMIPVNESEPDYSTKMTIINVLFGDLFGGGQEQNNLSEEDRDQNVIKAFEQFLDMNNSSI